MLPISILDPFTLGSFVGKHIATERRSFQNQATGKENDIIRSTESNWKAFLVYLRNSWRYFKRIPAYVEFVDPDFFRRRNWRCRQITIHVVSVLRYRLVQLRRGETAMILNS